MIAPCTSPGFASTMTAALEQMKGLRNPVVHEYGRPDDEIVFVWRGHRLGQFRRTTCSQPC